MYSLLVVIYSDLVVVKYFLGGLQGDKCVLLNWETPFIAYTLDRWHHQRKYAGGTRK